MAKIVNFCKSIRKWNAVCVTETIILQATDAQMIIDDKKQLCASVANLKHTK